MLSYRPAKPSFLVTPRKIPKSPSHPSWWLLRRSRGQSQRSLTWRRGCLLRIELRTPWKYPASGLRTLHLPCSAALMCWNVCWSLPSYQVDTLPKYRMFWHHNLWRRVVAGSKCLFFLGSLGLGARPEMGKPRPDHSSPYKYGKWRCCRARSDCSGRWDQTREALRIWSSRTWNECVSSWQGWSRHRCTRQDKINLLGLWHHWPGTFIHITGREGDDTCLLKLLVGSAL